MYKGVDSTIATSIFWQTPSKMVLIDQGLTIVEVTQEWLNCLGPSVALETFLGCNLLNLVPEEENQLTPLIEECLLTGKEQHLSNILIKTNNQRYSLRLKPFYDKLCSEIIGVIIQFDAVEAKTGYEYEIYMLKNRLKLKSEIAKIGSWEFNPLTEKIHLCEMAMMILRANNTNSYSLNQFIELFKIGFSQNKLSMLLFGATQKSKIFAEKLQLDTPENEPKWIMLNGRALENKILGTIQDISLIVNNEQRISEKENLINTLIDNLPTNIYIKDRLFRKTMVNKSVCHFYDVKNKDEILGKTDIELLGEPMGKITMKEETQIFKSKQPILNKQEEITTKNGNTTYLLTSKIPLINALGDVYSILGIGVDITPLKKQEEELKSLINVTSVQNKKLLNFAHIISHNLRSHTANFAMLLDFLIKENEPSEKEQIIKMLISASDGLSETLANLNQVINLRDNVSLKVEPINLYGQLEKLLEKLNSFIKKNNVIIINKVAEDIWVNAIEDYLDSIVMNFITNAVRYHHPNRQPKIVLKTKKEHGRIHLHVIDNGLGIDLNKHGKKLFGMYKTFHENTDAKGIGLYINKNQAEAMNCSLDVESEVGHGSTFSICFNE